MKIQSIQNLIERVRIVFEKSDDDKITVEEHVKITSDLTAQLQIKEEMMVELRKDKDAADALYLSFSTELMATYNNHLEEFAALREDNQKKSDEITKLLSMVEECAVLQEDNLKKDSEITKLLAMVNATEIPFAKQERQLVQIENLKSENEKMKQNISDLYALSHAKSLEISQQTDKNHHLSATGTALNKKLRKKNQEIEKLTNENKKLVAEREKAKANPFAYGFSK